MMAEVKENTANGSSSAYAAEPDPDTIKMFVGQIPRHWNEPECRKLFERYGPVFSLNILRDRASQQSKGCCFVTYYKRKDAIEAQGAMHNVVTIEGMHHPVQMKPADTENRNDRKLFVGQLCKKFDEEEVKAMFARFGTIEDCSVLRDADGKSRGCAFVTYTSRSYAVNATKEMHHSQTMEGCSAPLVVKFADSQKDKEVKAKGTGTVSPVMAGLAGSNLNLLQQFGGAGAGGLNMQQLAALLTLLQGGNNQVAQPQNNVLALLGSAALLQQQAAALQPQVSTSPQLDALAQLQQSTQLAAAFAAQQQQQQASPTNQLYALQTQAAAAAAAVHNQPVVSAVPTYNHFQHPSVAASQALQLSLLGGLPTAHTGAIGNGDVKGPEGANLFIYHLPQDFDDSHLLQTFAPFGTILSAKVFIDKVTNLSKCFGFVSYDNALSAAKAIQAMNGFQIGSKRLKVQLKTDRPHPYNKTGGQ